jgi:hypothetical protein
MTKDNNQKTLRASPNYIYRKIADKHVLVAIGDGIADFRGYIELNESAALLWHQVKDGKTRDQLVTAFVDAFGINVETAKKDIDDCLTLLLANGLVLE